MRAPGPHYLTLTALIPAAMEEELAALLAEWPVLGSEVRPEGVAAVRAIVYLEAEQTAAAELLAEHLAELGAAAVARGTLTGQDWLAPYRDRVRPFPLGRTWWIDPHPESPTLAPSGRLRLVVEPRMAFGSGSHESTQLLLLEMEDAPPVGLRVLDVGTGSGILAFAALALGATSVVALDIDSAAVWVARETAALQQGIARPLLVAGPVAALGRVRFPLVLCNMLPEHFSPVLPTLARLLAPGGRLLLSGLLASQARAVAVLVAEVGLAVVARRRLGEWQSLGVVHG